MRFASVFKIAFRALRRNKMRSGLTALGIIFGVAAVIAVDGLGNGAKSQVEAQIATLGQNVVLVFSGGTSSNGIRGGWGNAGTLKIEDADAIRREIPNVIGVSPEVRTSMQVVAGNQNWMTQVIGEGADYFDLRQWPFEDGAAFTDSDVRSTKKSQSSGKLWPGSFTAMDHRSARLSGSETCLSSFLAYWLPRAFRCRGLIKMT